MKLYLIRHGKTLGNTEGRYIGTTDEPLCGKGREELEALRELVPKPELIFVSPRKRCRETARLLWGDVPQTVIPGFAECDFGAFENKNYRELDGDPEYQRWIDSGGTLPFPGGESMELFRRRCEEAFLEVMRLCAERRAESAACAVHGGTIMSILSAFASSDGDFYRWQIKNAEGFVCRTDPESFAAGSPQLYVEEKLSHKGWKKGERQ